MASQTLVEAKKFINDEIVLGVVEDIITTNPMYNLLPFTPYDGQGLIVNRENALGDSGMYGVGDTITHKSAATSVQTVFTATKLIGDAEMDFLVKAQSSSAGVDQLGMEIRSKAKSIGRLFQDQMATGDAVGNNMHSFHTLTDAAQYTTASIGQAISLELLDELLDLVKSKDGEVDFLQMNSRTLRSYRALIRQLGGVNETIAFDMGYGRTRNVDVYNNIPIFKNDYLSVAETANGAALAGGALTSVYAGVFDDGTMRTGVSAIHPAGTPVGIDVQEIGISSTKDEELIRLKQYANFVNFNRKGLARLTSINN